MLTSWSEFRQCGCGRAAPTADRVYPPDPNGSSRTRSVFQAPPLGALFFATKSTKLRRFYNLGTAMQFYTISPLKRDRISRDRGLSAVRMKIARWVVRVRVAVTRSAAIRYAL